MPPSSVYTLPAGLPFLDCLAHYVLRESQGAPERLSDMLLLLPTRRACVALRDIFLRLSEGTPLLLPEIRPLGDGDSEDLAFRLMGFGDQDTQAIMDTLLQRPAIQPLDRLMLLTLLVKKAAPERRFDQAALLAKELAQLLDAVQTEGLSFEALDTLVPENLAHHWQMSLSFLKILSDFWPQILQDYEVQDPVARRNALLALQSKIWRQTPPKGLVIAAGATGSIPAIADMLQTIAGLPQGLVLLSGFDRDAAPAHQEAIRAEPSHPQYTLYHLLDRFSLKPEEIADWPGLSAWREATADHVTLEALAKARGHLIRDVMCPAEESHRWSRLSRKSVERVSAPVEMPPKETSPLDPVASEVLADLDLLECPGQREEAACIALLLRETLESPGRTAAVITPDRILARRIAAFLQRWHVEIDDSAGRPLRETPPAVFLRLTAAVMAEALAPVPLLAVLKHPMAVSLPPVMVARADAQGNVDAVERDTPAVMGDTDVPVEASTAPTPGQFRRLVRLLERHLLRGPRPAPGLSGLRQALAAAQKRAEAYQEEKGEEAARSWLKDLKALAQWLEGFALLSEPFAALMAQPERRPFADFLDTHLQFAEGLSNQGKALWTREDGEACRNFIAELREAAGKIGQIPARDYPGLLEALLQGENVRPRYKRHPRLSILGPMEARLGQADLLILAGLNEDVWPAAPQPDPWMSRPMRQQFGLPSPERMIGLAAHDFATFLAAPKVVLTRATRQNGTPTVPSRWLLRLNTVLSAMGQKAQIRKKDYYHHWQEQLNHALPPIVTPQESFTAFPGPPQPCPPITSRPRKLSVTQIENWLRDPYGLYARLILGLSRLEPLDADPGAAERGTIIHGILEAFVRRYPRDIPPNAQDELLAIGREAFADVLDRPGVWAFWWPRFETMAAWVIEQESLRRTLLKTSLPETPGRLELMVNGQPFIVTAKADRIDIGQNGQISILDYKTTVLPSAKAVMSGISPQLPLEAAIALEGGFSGVAKPKEGGVPPAEGPLGDLLYWRLKGGVPAGEERKANKIKESLSLARESLEGLCSLIRQFDDETMPYMPVPRLAYAPRYNDYAHLARIMEWAFATGEDL